VVGNVAWHTAMNLGGINWCVAPNLTAGKLKVPWWSFYAVDQIPVTDAAPPDGAVSLRTFRSERVLLDPPSLKAFYGNQTDSYRLSQALIDLEFVPMTVGGGKITMGPAPQVPQLKPLEGKSIVSLCGVESEKVLAALWHATPDSLPLLVKIAKATLAQFVVVVATEAGPMPIPFLIDR